MAKARTLFPTPHVEVKINILRENGFGLETQGGEFKFDNKIHKNLMSVMVNKSVGPEAGTFSMELSGAQYGIPSKEPDNPNDEIEITPQSIVQIFFNGTLKMIGLVDQVNVSISMAGGKPNLSTTIEGRDLTKQFIEQKLVMNEFVELSEAQKSQKRKDTANEKDDRKLKFEFILPSIFVNHLTDKWFTEISEFESFTIKYIGAGATALLTITGAKLVTKITGGPSGDNLNLLFSSFPTINSLVDEINNNHGASYIASLTGDQQISSSKFSQEKPVKNEDIKNITVNIQLEQKKTQKPIPQKSWYKFIFDTAFIGTEFEDSLYSRIFKSKNASDNIAFGFGNGASFADFFDTEFSMVSDNYLLQSPFIQFASILAQDVNILGLWNNVSFPPLVEIILDTYPPEIEVQNFNSSNTLIPGQNKLHLVVRENPFINDEEGDRRNFSRIPIHRIDLAQVKSISISKTDANTYNVVFVKPIIDMFKNNIDYLTIPSINNESLVRHGYKYLEIMLRYLDVSDDNEGVREGAIENMQRVADLMKNVYSEDYKKYSGVIEIHNMNDYRAGEKILIEVPTQSGKRLMEFYIQAVSDNFSYPNNHITRLNVIRGQETSEAHETVIEPLSRYKI